MSGDPPNPAAEQYHRVMNTLAALLANAQFLEATFERESPDAPLLADHSAAVRKDVLISLRHIVESSHALTSLLKR